MTVTQCPNIKKIQQPITHELHLLKLELINHVKTDLPIINDMAEHILNTGGKRLRPTITLLLAKALGYQGTEHQRLAAIVEWIHCATLLHDDRPASTLTCTLPTQLTSALLDIAATRA